MRDCRKAVSEYARKVGADPSVVALAVSEAASNVVFHAYRDTTPKPFTLEAEVEADLLVVSITDRGSGMRPNPKSSGLGLGISIIGNVTESVEFDSTESGLTVRMRFEIDG